MTSKLRDFLFTSHKYFLKEMIMKLDLRVPRGFGDSEYKGNGFSSEK